MPYTFQNSPGKLTQDLNKAFGKTLLEEFKRIGLKINITEWSILSYLSHKKTCTQKQISEFLGLEKVFVKRTLDRMEKNGWISRSQGKEDKRYNNIELTGTGKELFGKLKFPAQRTIEKGLRNINESDYLHFKKVSLQIIKNLEE